MRQALREPIQAEVREGQAEAHRRQIRKAFRQQRKAELANVQTGQQGYRPPHQEKAKNGLALSQRACRHRASRASHGHTERKLEPGSKV